MAEKIVEQGGDVLFRKALSRPSDNPRIEVLRLSSATRRMEPCSFYASTIHHFEGVGADKSLITLQDGHTIELSLPYEELAAKIDEGKSPVDLKGYCQTFASKPEIGDETAGPGSDIYVGQRNFLGRIFNVYAAPKDLEGVSTYKEAVQRVAALNENGRAFGNSNDIEGALEKGSYGGEYFIPPLEILKESLYKNKDQGALKDTFETSSGSGSDYPGWYWSSTENRDYPSDVHIVRLSGGNENWGHKGNNRLSCRPVRLVAATPALG